MSIVSHHASLEYQQGKSAVSPLKLFFGSSLTTLLLSSTLKRTLLNY